MRKIVLSMIMCCSLFGSSVIVAQDNTKTKTENCEKKKDCCKDKKDSVCKEKKEKTCKDNKDGKKPCCNSENKK